MSQLSQIFTNIANAIRNKTGSNELITPPEMATAIDNIPSGGELIYDDTIDGSTVLPNGTEIIVSSYGDYSGINNITSDGVMELNALVENSFNAYAVNFRSYVGTLGSTIIVNAYFHAQEEG